MHMKFNEFHVLALKSYQHMVGPGARPRACALSWPPCVRVWGLASSHLLCGGPSTPLQPCARAFPAASEHLFPR